MIGGVGILCCWAATFLILPAALAVLARHGLGNGRSPARLGRWLAALVPGRRPIVVGMTALVLVGSAAGAARYLASRPFEGDFKNLRSSGATMRETLRWNDEIDRAFGRGISGGTVIALPTRERAREVAERLRAADAGKPDKQRLFSRVTTLDDLVPPDQDDKLAVLADIHRLLTKATLASMSDADRQIARELDPPAKIARIADADVPVALGWPFTEQDGTRGRLLVAKTGAGFDLWRSDDLERFVATFRALGLGSDLVVGGNAFVQHDIVGSVDHDGPRATIVAAVGAVLVVLAILGLTRQAAVTIGCGAVGVFLLLTAAGLFGIRINFLDFVALPITIGIGIDYAVNVAARHRAEGTGSAARILTATGPAVALVLFHHGGGLRVAALLREPGDPLIRPVGPHRRADLRLRRAHPRPGAARPPLLPIPRDAPRAAAESPRRGDRIVFGNATRVRQRSTRRAGVPQRCRRHRCSSDIRQQSGA